jgi:hypothetical protein
VLPGVAGAAGVACGFGASLSGALLASVAGFAGVEVGRGGIVVA